MVLYHFLNGGLVKWLTHVPFTHAFTGSNPVPVTIYLKEYIMKEQWVDIIGYENKYNNSVDNLEWCTQYYNNIYGTRLNKVSNTLKQKHTAG